jgi:predicted RNA methylase
VQAKRASSFPAGAETFLSGLFAPGDAELFSGFGLYSQVHESLMRPFSRNVYTVIHESARKLKELASEITTSAAARNVLASLACRRGGTFRIWPMIDNRPASPKRYGVKDVERAVARTLGLRFSILSPEHCFYLSQRREGRSYFLLRTWSNDLYLPAKGELYCEVAYLLCRVAGAGPDDVLLDPFAGHGAIPRAASVLLKCRSVHANDIDSAVLPPSLAGVRTSCLDFLEDRLPLTERPSKIVTDPPWGDHRGLADKTAFYRTMIERCHGVLRESGVLTLLSANDSEVSDTIRNTPARLFSIETVFPLLVRGKKALVWKLIRS